MTWSEQSIAYAISTQLLDKRCIVLVPNCNWTGYECDVLGVTPKGQIIDVEVKTSRADLKADAKKDKWLNRTVSGYREVSRPGSLGARKPYVYQEIVYQSTAREHPRKVWKHYFALPAQIWKPELADSLPSKASGIILLTYRDGQVFTRCERRATPNKTAPKLTPEQVLDVARLANIRMWEAVRAKEQARHDERHAHKIMRAITGDAPIHPL